MRSFVRTMFLVSCGSFVRVIDSTKVRVVFLGFKWVGDENADKECDNKLNSPFFFFFLIFFSMVKLKLKNYHQ